jgi:hypothetical protein
LTKPQPIDMAALGLKPREMQVMRCAAWAWTQVSNGHYLTSPGQKRAAERMIARGFLTKVDAHFVPPVDWVVVKLVAENYKAMQRALRAAKRSRD